MTKAQFRKFLTENVSAERIVAKRDGTFEVKRGYFYVSSHYRHRNGAQEWGEHVMSQLGGKAELVATRDDWAAWPKDSYFVAVVRPSA